MNALSPKRRMRIIFMFVVLTIMYLYYSNTERLSFGSKISHLFTKQIQHSGTMKRGDQIPLNQGLPTVGQKPTIFAGIFSTPKRFHRRSLIRISYLQQNTPGLTFQFIVGKPKNPSEATLLKLEERAYGDILMLPIEENMDEGKTYEYFKSVTTRANEPFDIIMKIDDDNFVNVPQIMTQFQQMDDWKKLYWGREDLVHSQGRLSWLAGLGYAISWDAAVSMVNSDKCSKNRIGQEDSFVAECMESLGIPKHRVTPEIGIIDEPYAHETWSSEYSPKNIIIHQLKRNDWFLKACDYFIFGETPVPFKSAKIKETDELPN